MAMRKPRPAPPPTGAVNLTKRETAGFLGITERRVDDFRRFDATFPSPRLLGPGTARWRRVDLERWVESRPTGWCTTGGRRSGAFGRKPRLVVGTDVEGDACCSAAPEGPAAKTPAQ
jgi:predicted DNA-binding transcriptional regulator AlpA